MLIFISVAPAVLYVSWDKAAPSASDITDLDGTIIEGQFDDLVWLAGGSP